MDELPWELRNYRLSSAYMNLSLQKTREGPALNGSGLRVEDVVTGRRRLLLEGHAGSGKTTALRHLAIRGLHGELLREGDESPALVPFLIKMRGCHDGEKRLRLPQVEEFVAAVADTIAGSKPDRWVADLLEHGRGMVFLDGIDEISDKDRPAVLEWLKQLLAYYPTASYVLTSRPAAINEAWREQLRANDFVTARLEPMTPTQVDGFIDRWHLAVAEGAHTYSPGQVWESGQRLKGELAARRDLARLARSPLMCAILSAQHLRGNELCDSRSKIFRRSALVDFLVERRDVGRSIRKRSDWHRLLAPLAHWLVVEGEDTLPRRTAVRLIDRVTHEGALSAGHTLQLMMEQTGLLELVDGERVGFRFPGFQDYLAAQEFLDQMHHGHLVSHAHLPAYQEVVIMAVEQEAERDSWRVLSRLVDRARRSRSNHRRLWLLAAACIADLPPDGCPELADQIRSTVREFLPPRDLGEADELAEAGDFVLDLLTDVAWSGSVTNAMAPAVIRTAALIDADQAVPLLSRFRYVDDPGIQRELAAGWCRVRGYERYAREVLGDAALDTTWLDLPHVSALPTLRLITGLRNLRLPREADSDTLKALVELDGLPDRLEAISLADTAVTDLTPLARLPRLRWLDLSNTPVADLSPLTKLPGVKVRPARLAP
ncbi:NACHT domain-containing protein [Streptosporangium sp. NBC_01810]|uniref:NACHT domain-containing protein n=1 Tax=Streptosporangium sp. NBC_01810 TaxID=2975951 RepID=UPI002DDBD5CC|nr:NACHT domain-containing protein [Streptosporangium sp. NBC_01810]WSA23235.1 NACHT domain-containing protein [Streptosporangium sp. NBC_01810]